MNLIEKDLLTKERMQLLQHINDVTEKPLLFLTVVWLGLVIYEFVAGLNQPLEILMYTIWGIFIVDFIIEFIIAPHKGKYLQKNILTLLSLFLPAFRIFKLIKALKFLKASGIVRSVNLVKILTSFNKGIKTFKDVLRGKGIGYITILTIFIIFLGAAGIDNFEDKITNYGDALWFTAMLMTSMGSAYWPETFEGRILTFVLSIYALAIFGYLTATIASFLLSKDK